MIRINSNRGIEMDINQIWTAALAYIKQDINSVIGFNTYIRDAVPISFENNCFIN